METQEGAGTGRKVAGPPPIGSRPGLQYLPPQRKPPGGNLPSCTCCSPLSNHVCIQMRDLHPPRPHVKPPAYPAVIPERSIQEGDSRDSGYYGNNKNDFHNNLNKAGPPRVLTKPGLNNFNSNNGNIRGVDPSSRGLGRISQCGSTTDVAEDSDSTTSGSYVVDPEELDNSGGGNLNLRELTLRESVA